MKNHIIILGLKKAAVVLHAMAFQIKDNKTRNETLSLVDAINMAIKELEK